MSYVGHFLEMPELKQLDEITHHYTSTRLIHSIKVSYVSYLVCKKMGWNAKSAARNAAKITTLSDLEYDCIVKHMWGATIAPPRYKESWVVTLADDYVAMTEGVETARFKWKTRKYIKRHLPI